MSWGDIFFPGNPQRREDLIRKNEELKNLMENNFRATNKLIDILNEQLGYSFHKISLAQGADVKQNCEIIIERVREIQTKVEQMDQELKQKLEPILYEKLKNMDLHLCPSDHSKVAEAVGVAVGSVGTTVAVGWLMKTGRIFTDIVLKHGLIRSTMVAGFAIGALFVGIDMIAGAIMGSMERDKLENDLKEYDKALAEFKPASEEYQDSIFEVMAEIKRMKKKF